MSIILIYRCTKKKSKGLNILYSILYTTKTTQFKMQFKATVVNANFRLCSYRG